MGRVREAGPATFAFWTSTRVARHEFEAACQYTPRCSPALLETTTASRQQAIRDTGARIAAGEHGSALRHRTTVEARPGHGRIVKATPRAPTNDREART
jgi:hypothetical protein